MARSGLLLAISALALLVGSATPTRGNQTEPRDSQIPINFTYYPDLEHDTDQKECSAECGIRGGSGAANHDDKIVGGEDAEKDEFPWRCLLTYYTPEGLSSYCGCTILSENWVLTAAHCTYDFKKFEVFAGLLDYRKKQSADYKSGPALQVFSHRLFDPDTKENDIALIRVSRPMTFGSSIKPACMPYSARILGWENPTVTASGWGSRYSGDESPPTVLQKLDNLPLITRRKCREHYKGRHNISNTMVCTYRPGFDTCQGDSGGSIDYLDKNDGRYKAVGIVSFGYGCADKGSPGVYTWIGNYFTWIREKTGRDFCG